MGRSTNLGFSLFRIRLAAKPGETNTGLSLGRPQECESKSSSNCLVPTRVPGGVGGRGQKWRRLPDSAARSGHVAGAGAHEFIVAAPPAVLAA